MAAANYSSYNSGSKSLVKKKAPPKLVFNNVNPPLVSSPKPKAASLKKPTTPVRQASPLPVTPVLQPVGSIAPTGPPPQTLQSGSDRIDARGQYGLGQSDVNRQIYDAALNYGGVDQAQQFGYDPTTGVDSSSNIAVSHNPEDNSALSVIARNAALAGKNVDETSGAQNTFFSSRRLGDLQTINSDADRQRAAAKKAYDDAVAGYLSQITGLRLSRDSGLRNSDISDIQAATANDPTNQIPQQGAKEKPTQSIPNYRSPSGAIGTLHIYADGRRVFVKKG